MLKALQAIYLDIPFTAAIEQIQFTLTSLIFNHTFKKYHLNDMECMQASFLERIVPAE